MEDFGKLLLKIGAYTTVIGIALWLIGSIGLRIVRGSQKNGDTPRSNESEKTE